MNPDTFVPRRRWRVAVVGAGYFSQFHLQAWVGMPDVDIVGLCDIDPARAEALGQRFGITERFTQAQSMLDACAPDLVDVVLPPANQAGVSSALWHAPSNGKPTRRLSALKPTTRHAASRYKSQATAT